MEESKWADYVVSAVKRGPGSGRISQVQVHVDRGNSLGHPEIVDKIKSSKDEDIHSILESYIEKEKLKKQ